jgi:hypothetical protein
MKQSVERLEITLARVAKEQGLAQERLRRWVSFLALCGVMEQAVNEGTWSGPNCPGDRRKYLANSSTAWT